MTVPAKQAQIDMFTRALFGHESHAPEMRAAAMFQRRSIELGKVLSAAGDQTQTLTRPIDMLTSQSALLRSILTVDLTAKAAGMVSQGVNKLANMQ